MILLMGITFKIWGERNSGTNYLQNLIQQNFGNIFVHRIINNTYYYWKHGIPCNSVKNYLKNEIIVDIFIFRNLDDWLMSMYKNQYCLKCINNLENFLTFKQTSIEKKYLDFRTNKPMNYDDNDKSIFEIRNYKFASINDYFNNNNNVILVNLNYLQENNENVITFLNSINLKYNLKKNENDFIINFVHTKDKSNNKKRNYDIDLRKYKHIITSNKNEKVEEFISNLKFIIKS